MDELRFEEVLYDDGHTQERDAVPYVNGRNLIEWVAQIEQSAAAVEGGRIPPPYRGLAAPRVFAPAPPLGDPRIWPKGFGPVLRCECGEDACAPLIAEIVFGETSFVWRNFRNPHHLDWSFEELGPFEFDRDEYEAAFRR